MNEVELVSAVVLMSAHIAERGSHWIWTYSTIGALAKIKVSKIDPLFFFIAVLTVTKLFKSNCGTMVVWLTCDLSSRVRISFVRGEKSYK